MRCSLNLWLVNQKEGKEKIQSEMLQVQGVQMNLLNNPNHHSLIHCHDEVLHNTSAFANQRSAVEKRESFFVLCLFFCATFTGGAHLHLCSVNRIIQRRHGGALKGDDQSGRLFFISKQWSNCAFLCGYMGHLPIKAYRPSLLIFFSSELPVISC